MAEPHVTVLVVTWRVRDLLARDARLLPCAPAERRRIGRSSTVHRGAVWSARADAR